MNNSTRQGGCLCGQVRYTVPAKPIETVVCHCRNCQKQAGSAFSVVAFFQRDTLQLTGELQTFEDRGTSGQKVFRRFCGNCGSPVITDTEDEVDDLQPSLHCWVSSKQCWLTLADDQVQLQQQESL
jgi:hypothetical protein